MVIMMAAVPARAPGAPKAYGMIDCSGSMCSDMRSSFRSRVTCWPASFYAELIRFGSLTYGSSFTDARH